MPIPTNRNVLAVRLGSAQLTPRSQAFLFEGMFDRLATIGVRPRWGRWKQRQLRDHTQVRRQLVEHTQDAEQRIGSLLQQLTFTIDP